MSHSNNFSSTVVKQHKYSNARVLQIHTPHGDFLTPAFMPVATRAVLNSVDVSQLTAAGSQIILGGNTYHMLCAPGMDIIQKAGGMHPFMQWHAPMLTDSGGFQVFSLSKNSKICKINADGAVFKHPITGQTIKLTPQTSIATQKIIGADIIMAFDQCTPDTDDTQVVKQALERTHNWLQQSISCHNSNPYSAYGNRQALFGIIQGGFDQTLRRQCTEFVVSQQLDGIAIGGETIGFDMQKTNTIIEWIYDLLPINKPRYTMGVGMEPNNLCDVVHRGIDMFDCVAPTRNARHGALYHGEIKVTNHWVEFASEHKNARINISKKIYANDHNPIHPLCTCYTCANFSRAYLHYLFKSKSYNYSNLASIHNIHTMHAVCTAMRNLILQEGS